jgi:N-acetyl sugar amidotransferase
MSALTRCKECLMPTTRPDTAFVDGVCSACVAHKRRKEIDWDRRHGDLLKILESAKVNADGYHCVVPSSGGKDSHWQVLKLLELGVKPLVVTATTCMLTETGKANIRNLARYATTIEVTPNLRVRALLNRLGLELVGDISWPEHVSINCAPFKVAIQMGIPLIFYGESPLACYGSPHDASNDMVMTKRWIMEFGGHLGLRPGDLVGQHGLRREDMADYTMPRDEQMEKVTAYFLGQFHPWCSHRNANVAFRAGMSVPGQPPSKANYFCAENLDNAQTGLHDWMGYTKYAYGRACAQVSIDIRHGLLSREEGITIVRSIDGIFPEYYMGVHYAEILEHIGLPEPRFWELARQYANKALFDVSGERPVMKPEVWEASFC